MCTCPGDILTYECTVVSTDHGFTVLRGEPNFTNCMGSSEVDKIVLSHLDFGDGTRDVITCNNHAITGQILRAKNETYTSQFNVTVTAELIGSTIECVSDDGASASVIGNFTINGTGGVTIKALVILQKYNSCYCTSS